MAEIIYRPIAESEPRMTLLCAAGVNLNGGLTPDGGCMIGESIFYAKDDEKAGNTLCLGECVLQRWFLSSSLNDT